MKIFFAWILFRCIGDGAVAAILMGTIPNASLLVSSPTVTQVQAACDVCLCMMFTSTGNASILSLNCYSNSPSSVTCEMFTLETYLTSSFFGMKINSSSRFFFRQLPSSNASGTTVVTATSRKGQTYTDGRGLFVEFSLLPCSIHRCKYQSYIHKHFNIK